MEKNNIFTICGVAVYAVFALLVIKELRRDTAQSASFGIFAVMLCVSFPIITELVNFAIELSSITSSDTREHIDVILKSLGITYITYVSSEICKSGGEGTIASQIELIGRAEILLLCIPYLKEIVSLALI